MENKKTKIIIILSSILLVFVLGFTFYIVKNKDRIWIKNQGANTELKNLETPIQEKTTMVFVGDLMLTRGVESSVNKNFNGDYSLLFKNIENLKKADIVFGNLEGPVSDLGNNVGSKYSFRMNPSVITSLKEVGFDIFSFANNHVGDWNVSAFNDTLNRINDNGLLKTGAGKSYDEASDPTIIERNGIRFGFLGFSDVGPKWMEAKANTSGVLLASDPKYSEIITRAKEKADVLIVSIHFGDEYKPIHNKRQEELAHMAIDSGADLVIGHHPHVIEDAEYYKGKPIFYSLGNFIFDQSWSKETMRGLFVETTFEGKDLKEIKTLVSIQNKKFQIEGLFNQDEIKDVEELIYSNCPKPNKDYSDMGLLAVGQDTKIPFDNYIPKDMVPLGKLSVDGNLCLVQDTKKALSEMISAASKEGIKIKATSAYRSYEHQKTLYNNALIDNPRAKIAVAKPGHSEHQLGTTVDLSGLSIGYSSATSSFDNTKEEIWLRDNAYKYGFIMSYPYDKVNVTGYMYEPWHYRYLGKNITQKIKDSGLTVLELLK
ncbi:MAG: hypothetical protein EOM85_01455 [Candidatus Moranbacteria bacterium]|nr:hypothetical protein [Candidatus Moranbacteria bacterium]